MNAPLLANLALLVPVLAWGLPIPFMDTFFDRWDPVLASALRYPVALPFVWIAWRTLRRAPVPLKPNWVGWGPMIRVGGIGLIGFTVTYSFALDHMHPVTAAVLSAAAPVVSATVARLLFGRPMGKGIGLALLLAVIGGVLCTVDLDQVEGFGFVLRGGEPLFVLAAAFWAWYSLETQRVLPGLPQVQATLLTLIPAAILLPPLYLLLYALGLSAAPPVAGTWRDDDIGVLLWVSIFGIAAATVAWNLGVKLVGVVVASLYLNLIPIAAILTALLLGVEPRPLQLVGGAVVLAGVVQAQLRLLKERRQAAATAAPTRPEAIRP